MSTEDVHASFYATQLAAILAWWLLIRVTTGRHLHVLSQSSVLTRPCWLPTRWLLLLHNYRQAIFAGLPLSLAVGAVAPNIVAVRLAVAILISVYHLTEVSATNRHGEYPLLYNAWAMCLPNMYASAAAFGVAVHFVLSSGVAKLWVGGLDWLAPDTLRAYLQMYGRSRSSPPLSKLLNLFLSERAWATAAAATIVVVTEVLLVPGTLLLPTSGRWLGSAAMILMHLGIVLCMSAKATSHPLTHPPPRNASPHPPHPINSAW